jgi:hypothetical protein
MGFALLTGCAQVSSPMGGPVDETPPQVLQMEPPNGVAGLQLETLTIEFDEFVLARNALQQLLISPPIQGTPEFKTRGKAVSVNFDPSWFADETTYVLSFGDGLVDLHESNPAEALFFAFSTGLELDTLTLNGQVVDRLTGEGVIGLRTLFYADETPWDSIWAGVRPVGISITDEDGKFEGSYLASGNYKAIAVDDVNRDYVWNPGESLAFSNESRAAGDSWSLPWLFAPTASPLSPAYISSASIDSSGFCRIYAPLVEGQRDEKWAILEGVDSLDTRWCRTGDSVNVWTQTPRLIENALAIWSWSDGADSLPARLNRLPLSTALKLQPQWPSKTSLKSDRMWGFDRVLTSIDASLWSLTEDTLRRVLMQEDLSISKPSEGGSSVRIRTMEQPGERYSIRILPEGVHGREGQANPDTLEWKWATWPEDYFGSLTIFGKDLPGPGWFRCFPRGKSDSDLERFRCETDSVVRWSKLPPGKYEVGFELDANNDSIWQSMNPLMQQIPEPYFYIPEVIDVRSNWDVEMDWSLPLDSAKLQINEETELK